MMRQPSATLLNRSAIERVGHSAVSTAGSQTDQSATLLSIYSNVISPFFRSLHFHFPDFTVKCGHSSAARPESSADQHRRLSDASSGDSEPRQRPNGP